MDIVKTPKVIRSISFVSAAIILILISGLRWRTGPDWPPYEIYFNIFDINDKFSLIIFEPGYVLLTYIVKCIFLGNYTTFLLLFGSLIIGFRFKFFAQNTHYVFLALLLFLGSNLCEIFPTRQSLAISICLLSMPYIQKKKLIPHIIITMIGMQLHFSSIIWLTAYPIYHLNWSIKWKIVFLLLAIGIGLGGFLDFMLSFMSSNPLLGRYSDKAGDYQKMGTEMTAGTNKTTALLVGIIKRAVLLPVFFYYESKVKDPLFRKYMNLFVFGNIIYFLVINLLALQRISGIFYMFEIILLCRMMESIQSRRKKILWFLIIALYALIKMMFIVISTKDYMLPYYWIFSPSFERKLF